MKIISDSEFAEFLVSKPLYTTLTAVEHLINQPFTYTNPLDFKDKAFKYLCPVEKETHTFRTDVFGGTGMYGRTIFASPEDADRIPAYYDQQTGMLDLTVRLVCSCQSCHAAIDFLLKTRSDKPWSRKMEGINISIEKIGQWPAFSVQPEKIVQKYLTEEDVNNYRRALTSLSVGFGIGAYAYFRRIIENEIIRIIKDISELEFEGADRVKEAYRGYEQDRQMTNLISSITPFLPSSIMGFGDNPIKLLYAQLSGGIHEFADKECLEKAQAVDLILNFVIKKVNEEKYQLKDVKLAIEKLRKK